MAALRQRKFGEGEDKEPLIGSDEETCESPGREREQPEAFIQMVNNIQKYLLVMVPYAR